MIKLLFEHTQHSGILFIGELKYSSVEGDKLTLNANWFNWAKGRSKESNTVGLKEELTHLFNKNKEITKIDCGDALLDDKDFVKLCEAILSTKTPVTEITASSALINNKDNKARIAIESLRPYIRKVELNKSKQLPECPLEIDGVEIIVSLETFKHRPTHYADSTF